MAGIPFAAGGGAFGGATPCSPTQNPCPPFPGGPGSSHGQALGFGHRTTAAALLISSDTAHRVGFHRDESPLFPPQGAPQLCRICSVANPQNSGADAGNLSLTSLQLKRWKSSQPLPQRPQLSFRAVVEFCFVLFHVDLGFTVSHTSRRGSDKSSNLQNFSKSFQVSKSVQVILLCDAISHQAHVKV